MKKILSLLMLLVASTAMSWAEDTWTVAGTAAAVNGTADWAETNAENDMISADGTNYTLTVTNCTLEKGVTYQYKVVKNHDWKEAYPGSNKTFTVSETALYTVEYKFNAETHDVSETTTKTGTAGEITHTYSLAGSPATIFGADWDPTNTGTDMQLGTDGLYWWKTDGKELAAGSKIKFKVVVDHSWGQAYPASDYVQDVVEAGTYDITFTFNATTKDVNCILDKKGDSSVENVYIVAGSSAELFGTTWDGTNETNKMEEVSTGLYSKSYTDVTLPAGEIQWKVVQNGSTWIPDGEGNNNIVGIPEDGIYDVTFTYNATNEEMTCDAVKKGEAVITTTYVVAGNSETLFGTTWDGTAEANKMEKDASGIWTKEYKDVSLTTGSIEWKVVKNGTTWIPDGSNLSIYVPEDGKYDVIFTYNGKDNPASKLMQGGKEVIVTPKGEGWPANYGGVMIQAFYWNSYEDTQWRKLTEQVETLSKYFDILWVPNSSNCVAANSMGYLPVYWLDHRSSFGSRERYLTEMIAAFHEHGTKVIEDVVLNHKAPVGKDGSYIDFANETKTVDGVTYELKWSGADICQNDDGGYIKELGWEVTGANDTGDDFSGARDLDHTGANVQKNCMTYLDYLLNALHYDGFRLDMVKGYSPEYTKLYNEHSQPEFCVGEYWDGYDNIMSWVARTGYTSAAFDFPLKYVFRDAFGGGDWSAFNTKGMAGDPNACRYAVTFVDNHDTYENEGRLVNGVLGANAFILAMPGTPCIFLKHWQRYPIAIGNMILARKAAGITNQSPIVEQKLLDGGYVIKVQGTKGTVLCMAGSPSYDTTGFNLISRGQNFAYFLSDNVTVEGLQEGNDDEEAKDITIYVQSEEAPYIYAWNASGDPVSGAWPGQKLTESTTVSDGTTFWTANFTKVPVNIIFNNGADVQTSNIENITHDSYFTFDPTNKDKEKNWTDVTEKYYTPNITLPDCAKPIEGHIYVYFQTNKDYDTPYAWVWGNEGKNFCTNTDWPGDKMQKVGYDSNGHGVYLWDGGAVKDGDELPTALLFSNNGSPKTDDFTFRNGGYYDATGFLASVIKGLKGDVNGDGTVDVADISAIISVMAGTANYTNADVNGDGTVDVADISTVIDIMAK